MNILERVFDTISQVALLAKWLDFLEKASYSSLSMLKLKNSAKNSQHFSVYIIN